MSLLEKSFLHTPISLFVCNTNGSFVETNGYFQSLTGYSQSALKNLSLYDLFVDQKDTVEKVRQAFAQQNQTIVPLEAQIKHQKGHTLDIILKGAHITDDKGQPFVSLVLKEVGELRKAERLLNKAQEMGHIGHWDLDLVNNKLHWSDETYRIFGLEPQEFEATYEAFVERIFPEDRDEVNQAYTHSLEVDEPYQIEHRVIRPDGSIRYVIERCEHNHDKEGTIIGSMGTVIDVTHIQEKERELLKAKEAAEAANIAKSAFIASMSHELRTPLNAILGFAKQLSNDDSLSGKAHKNLAIINRSGEHLLTMINEILDMSKIESGEMHAELAPFGLHEMLYQACELLKGRAREKNIAVKLQVDPDVPHYVITDENKLHQLIINIAGNAIKFTEHGSVTVNVNAFTSKASSKKTRLAIAITDTGRGIPKEQQEQIFKPFVQTKEMHRGEGGTGLGLAISRKLAQLLGGEIVLESAIGKGSTFTITFECEISGPISSLSIDKSKKIIGFSPKEKNRMLIVDDVATNRILLKVVFEELGFEIKEAKSGDEALTIFKEWPADFIWMDIEMAGLNGYETSLEIRNLPQGKETKIAAISASVLDEDRARFDASACDYFVAKPFSNHELYTILKEALHIQYIYQESAKSSTDSFDPALIHELETSSYLNLLKAAEKSSGIKMKKALKEIQEGHETLYKHLSKLASDYDFDTIMNLLKDNDATS